MEIKDGEYFTYSFNKNWISTCSVSGPWEMLSQVQVSVMDCGTLVPCGRSSSSAPDSAPGSHWKLIRGDAGVEIYLLSLMGMKRIWAPHPHCAYSLECQHDFSSKAFGCRVEKIVPASLVIFKSHTVANIWGMGWNPQEYVTCSMGKSLQTFFLADARKCMKARRQLTGINWFLLPHGSSWALIAGHYSPWKVVLPSETSHQPLFICVLCVCVCVWVRGDTDTYMYHREHVKSLAFRSQGENSDCQAW